MITITCLIGGGYGATLCSGENDAA